jgi:hypothetical protein
VRAVTGTLARGRWHPRAELLERIAALRDATDGAAAANTP